MLRQIIEKEFPLRDAPKSGHLMIVEANHESGNDVELLSETRQGTKRVDLLNDAADTEQARDFPEHRQAIHVEPDSGMTKELRDVEKVPCAATQIENALGTRHVEFKLANPPDINSDPTVEIRDIWASPRRDLPPRIAGESSSNSTGSIVSMTRFVSSGKRFARSSLRVRFLALARLWPSTSFRILWRNCTAHTL